MLERAADLFEADRAGLMALLVREAGKTLRQRPKRSPRGDRPSALFGGRSAPQFHRDRACLKGPTGEENELSLRGRGVFACISPWNFPLAIFTGQIAGALAAGNAVVAKPAEQTPLVAARAMRLMHQAGVPPDVLHLLPGRGETVGAALVADKRVDGVAFTGGTETGIAINRGARGTRRSNRQADRRDRRAERNDRGFVGAAGAGGGRRADVCLRQRGTALLGAARAVPPGRHCGANRCDMLLGAARELKLGDPLDYATDIGPVIDEDARAALEAHKARMRARSARAARSAAAARR